MAVKAVEVVREIRDKHYEVTKGLSVEEQIEFVKGKSRKLQSGPDRSRRSRSCRKAPSKQK